MAPPPTLPLNHCAPAIPTALLSLTHTQHTLASGTWHFYTFIQKKKTPTRNPIAVFKCHLPEGPPQPSYIKWPDDHSFTILYSLILCGSQDSNRMFKIPTFMLCIVPRIVNIMDFSTLIRLCYMAQLSLPKGNHVHGSDLIM